MSQPRRYRFVTADVFTSRAFGGNPLAVFPRAEGLPPETMQAIAREFNFSETTFVLPPERSGSTRRVRIFTPRAELPFAGHPTIGTAHVLVATGLVGGAPGASAERGAGGAPGGAAGTGMERGAGASGHGTVDLVFDEGVGPIPVQVTLEEGQPRFAEMTVAKLPESGPAPPDDTALAAMLSLSPDDLLGAPFQPQAFSCGLPFLYVPLRSRQALSRARLDTSLWRGTLRESWARDVFVLAWDGPPGGPVLHARMFAPGSGIEEDPATGSAAAALSGYLAARDASTAPTLQWTINQGADMGRPSLLRVLADRSDGRITRVRVGGSSVLMTEGELLLEPPE
jgi:trans-2,3-dihydro-3-hydroxyanthranilate isomerase